MASRTSEYYKKNPKARKAKSEYDTQYHSTPSRRKYRSKLNKENRKRGTYGNGDGKDSCHTSKGNKTCSAKANRKKKGIHK